MISNYVRGIFIPLLSSILFSIVETTSRNSVLSQPIYDGFNVYCTGNRDGTGLCVNRESSEPLDCIIIPGQVIDCKTGSGKSFQCVLFQQYTLNQAEFACDPDVERMISEEVPSDLKGNFANPFIDPL